MEQPLPDNETQTEEIPQSFVRIDFPAGNHTTNMTLQISNLDLEQILMAARMLERYFNDQYKEITQKMKPRILVANNLPPNLGRN